MGAMHLNNSLFHIEHKARWLTIIGAFVLISVLDFFTPSEYILAYLYTIPILISVSFLKPRIAKTLLIIAVLATLLNLVFPLNTTSEPSIVINRCLAALSIIISAIFMIRYIRYQEQIKQQEYLLESERRLSQMREDFIATLTHDLRTPLLGEEKTLQYLAEGTFGPITTEQADVLAALVRSNKRQRELVENLLSVYRHDNIGVDLRMASVNLDELIADALTEVQYLALERNIQLVYHCRRTPPNIRGDAFQLKRVMANLLHNALNYTPAGKQVEVNLIERNNELLVTVRDSGPGLSPDALKNLFIRFYREEGVRHMVGTGLGLYLSRQLVIAHRGRIWAENRSEGGCQFSFSIPMTS